MKTEVVYIEYRCSNCEQPLWSNNPEEIKIFQELHEQGELKCPLCNSPVKFFRAMGNGGKK